MATSTLAAWSRPTLAFRSPFAAQSRPAGRWRVPGSRPRHSVSPGVAGTGFCSGGSRGQYVVRGVPLSVESATALLDKVHGWEMYEDAEGRLRLKRQWKMRNFPAGLELFQMMGEVAEDMKHHPDLHLEGWNKVTVEIWSHETGGLTEADFELAAKLAALPVKDLLWKPRKKKAADSA